MKQRYIDAMALEQNIAKAQEELESNVDKVWDRNKPYHKGLAQARRMIAEAPTVECNDADNEAEVIRLTKELNDVQKKLIESEELVNRLWEQLHDNTEHFQCVMMEPAYQNNYFDCPRIHTERVEEHTDRYIQNEMCNKLAHNLLEQGYAKFTKEKQEDTVYYRMDISIVKPVGKN